MHHVKIYILVQLFYDYQFNCMQRWRHLKIVAQIQALECLVNKKVWLNKN